MSMPSYPVGPGSNTEAPEYPAASRKTAGWALALCCVPCVLSVAVGLTLAIKVLTKGKDGRDHGRRMAIAALCLAGLWIVAGTAAAAVSVALGLAETKPEDERATLAPTELEVGHCFDLGPDGEVSSIAVVPCHQAHQTEVFAEFKLKDGPFPGYDALIADAEAGCTQRLEEFIGIPAESSALEIHQIYPHESSWPEWRTVSCTVSEPADRPRSGSLRGAKR